MSDRIDLLDVNLTDRLIRDERKADPLDPSAAPTGRMAKLNAVVGQLALAAAVSAGVAVILLLVGLLTRDRPTPPTDLSPVLAKLDEIKLPKPADGTTAVPNADLTAIRGDLGDALKQGRQLGEIQGKLAEAERDRTELKEKLAAAEQRLAAKTPATTPAGRRDVFILALHTKEMVASDYRPTFQQLLNTLSDPNLRVGVGIGQTAAVDVVAKIDRVPVKADLPPFGNPNTGGIEDATAVGTRAADPFKDTPVGDRCVVLVCSGRCRPPTAAAWETTGELHVVLVFAAEPERAAEREYLYDWHRLAAAKRGTVRVIPPGLDLESRRRAVGAAVAAAVAARPPKGVSS